MLKVMSGMVILTGGLVALSILATNPSEEGPTLTAMARAPASLVGMALTTTKPTQPLLERTSTLEINCAPPEVAQVNGDIKQLRLIGRLCKGQTSTEILNLTNGYTATLFTPRQGRFASDFIHLADGANRLRVTQTAANGQSQVHEFQVQRK